MTDEGQPGRKRAPLIRPSLTRRPPSPAEGEKETALAARPEAEREHPASNHAFTAGRLWDDGKNVAALDRAAARLSVPVVAAGSLDGPNGTRASFPNLRCLGRLDDAGIAAEFARQPIFVSTALYEPFGLAILEAAQAGCALVLSDIPTFRELWDGAAIFVPATDEAAIAQAIEDLIGDPVTRAALADAARRRSALHSAERMAAGVLGVYEVVLGRGFVPSAVTRPAIRASARP